MKPMLAILLTGLLSVMLLPAVAATEPTPSAQPQLTLIYNSTDAALAHALEHSNVVQKAVPKVDANIADVAQPLTLLLSRAGLTDAKLATLGASQPSLLRLTLTAQTEKKLEHPQDAYNGLANAQVYYLYLLRPKDATQLSAIQQQLDNWYKDGAQSTIEKAGFTRLPSALMQENRVTLGLAAPKFSRGYR